MTQDMGSIFEPCTAAGPLDENPPHGFRRGGKEVPAILPLPLAGAAQSLPGFVNQRGRLQSLGA